MAKNVIKKLKNATKTLRPTATLVNNSLDIDSIYNHSIPKKVTKSILKTDTDDVKKVVSEVINSGSVSKNTSKSRLTQEEQKALDKANELWKKNRETEFAQREKEIVDRIKSYDDIFATPEEIMDPNFISTFDPIDPNVDIKDPKTWTDDFIINNAVDDYDLDEMINKRDEAVRFEKIDPDKPATWTDEYVRKTAKTSDELNDMTQRMREAKNLDTVELINQQRNAEDVPKNRQQRRQEAKENKNKGNGQKKKSKKQKAKEKRQQQFEARNKALGRDPEEIKNMNREINQQRKETNAKNREQKRLDAEKAKANKANAEEAYQKAMDQINSKSDLERLEFYNTTPEQRAFDFRQDNPDISKPYQDLNGYKGNKVNEQIEDFIEKNAAAEEFIKNNFDNLDNGKINADSILTGEYTANKRYVDDAGNLIKTRRTIKNTPDAKSLADASKVGLVTTGINVLSTIGDYKDERKKGHGVVSSAVRAGAKFAMYEALGLWSIPVALVSNVPGAVIKGADMLYKENRRMNSAANFEAFGGAQFMDTQQLATMRQSGMEMAKMANYNLQQTLMGNEATYLHR